MTHQQHVNLIRQAILDYKGSSPFGFDKLTTSQSNNNQITWADLGFDEGAFTLTLAELLPSGSKIYSMNKNGLPLKAQEANFKRQFPFFTFEYLQSDFTSPLTLHTLPPYVTTYANIKHRIRIIC